MSQMIDKQIDKLMDKIETKKAEIASIKKSIPIQWKTKCVLEKDGEKHTIQTIKNTEKLLELAGWLILNKEAQQKAVELFKPFNLSKKTIASKEDEVVKEEIVYQIQGFNIDDWLSDVMKQYNQIEIQKEENKLQKLSDKLITLTSEDKRREIEFKKLLQEFDF